MDRENIQLLNSFQALGTLWNIECFFDNTQTIEYTTALQKEIEEQIQAFESTYSRFCDDSALTALNTTGTVKNDSDLVDMIFLGEKMNSDTGGVFDIFIKEQLEEKGYGSKGGTEKIRYIKKDLPNRFYVEQNSIFLNSQKQVDLGGIGKGYLIDKLAKYLRDSGVTDFIINGGGDIFVSTDKVDPMVIYLQHPTEKETSIGELVLSNQSMCASSSFQRVWEYDGKIQNHFVSDKEVVAAAYVVAKDTTIADMLATVFCILAEEEGQIKKIAEIYSAEYLVIGTDGKVLQSDQFNMIQ